MTINAKNSYFAQGDNVTDGGAGPSEVIVGSNQIMTAARFAALEAGKAIHNRLAETASQHGGHDIAGKGRLFETAKVEAGVGAGQFSIVPSVAGYDSGGTQIAGHCPKRAADGLVLAQPAASFLIDTSDLDAIAHFDDVPYEDAGGSEYNVGIAISTVPTKAEQNPRTGKFEFTEETAIVGVAATPFSVAYSSGLNQTTFEIDNDKLMGNASSLAGRSAMVWFLDGDGYAKGETSTAIQFATIAWNGTRNVVTISGAFGQELASVITTATNYVVCLLGPAVWVGAIDVDNDGVAWIAHGDNDTAWVMDGQTNYPSTFHLLQNFVRMSVPSASGTDLTSNPKISIRPNNNEAGSELQIAVYSDAAGSTLVFGVDKDGNILGSIASSLSFGVDTATAGVETGIEVYHTESGGVGVVGKGVRIELALETSTEGVKEPAGSVSAIIRDVTPTAVDGELILSSYSASTEVETAMITEHGELLVSSNILGKVGPAAAANSYDPHIDGGLGIAIAGAGGSTSNAIVSFNTTPFDGAGARTTTLGTLATTLAGVIHSQMSIVTKAKNAGTDVQSKTTLNVNDGSGLTETLQLDTFDDWNAGTNDSTGVRFDALRSLAGGTTAIRASHDVHAASGAENLLELSHNSNTTSATMIAAAAELRLAWHLSASDPFDDEIFHLGVAPVTNGYEMRFGGFDPSVEVLVMNVRAAATKADSRVEIMALGSTAVPDPFVTENLSPLQVLVDGTVDDYSGIDIGNRTAGNLDGDRSSGINFLGIRAGTGTEGRLGGIRCHYDADLGPGTAFQAGKLSLFVNDGDTVNAASYGVEIYSTGYVRAPNIPAIASVTHGAPPTYASQRGFAGATAITNPATGRYILTLATAMTGASLNDPVFVQPTTDGYGGRGFWASTTTIECRTWNASGVLANDDFFVQAYATATLKVA